MKTYFFILFVALLGARAINAFPKSSKIVPDCSQYEDGEKLPDSNSCSQYYLCVGGKSLPQRCARGLYYDAMSGLCNRAFLVDCTINRLGQSARDIVNSISNINFGNKNDERPIPHASPCIKDITLTTTPCTTTTTPCKTTSKTTTPTCTTKTTTCTTTTTTTPCKTTSKATTLTCTTKSTTCTTTTSCTTTKPTTTKCSTTKPTTTTCTTTKCTTTTCTTTTCTTPKLTKATCSSTKATCTTTKSPCTTTLCVTTAATQTQVLDENLLTYRTSSRDCHSLPEGTILLDYNHCRRYYICIKRKTVLIPCRTGYWFDQDTRTCRPRSSVTNCAAGRP